MNFSDEISEHVYNVNRNKGINITRLLCSILLAIRGTCFPLTKNGAQIAQGGVS